MKKLILIIIFGIFTQCESNIEKVEDQCQCGKVVSFVEYAGVHKIILEFCDGDRKEIWKADAEPKIGELICL